MMSRITKIHCKASFTVEALVIILMFFITIAFIYLNFFLHDKNIFIANLNELVENYEETREEGLNDTTYLVKELNKGLWMMRVIEASAEIKGSHLKIKAILGQAASDEVILLLFPSLGFSYAAEKNEWLFSRSESARILTVGIDTLEHVKGIGTMIEKFK